MNILKAVPDFRHEPITQCVTQPSPWQVPSKYVIEVTHAKLGLNMAMIFHPLFFLVRIICFVLVWVGVDVLTSFGAVQPQDTKFLKNL